MISDYELGLIIDKAESLGWRVDYGNGEFEFQKYSPAGQDFNMSIDAETVEELLKRLSERCDDFDCSAEAYLWLDESGHGRNGAPYDMKELYEDMEACQKMMQELSDVMREVA